MCAAEKQVGFHWHFYNQAQTDIHISHSVHSSDLNLDICIVGTSHHLFFKSDGKNLTLEKIILGTEPHVARVGLDL